jgi:hypothetical protein
MPFTKVSSIERKVHLLVVQIKRVPLVSMALCFTYPLAHADVADERAQTDHAFIDIFYKSTQSLQTDASGMIQVVSLNGMGAVGANLDSSDLNFR